MVSQLKYKGNTLVNPQVVILSSDTNSVIGSVSGDQATKRANFKSVLEKVEQFEEDGTVGAQPNVFSWYMNTQGAYKNLPFSSIDSEHILLGNKKFKHSQLQPGAIKFAKRYQEHQLELKIGSALKDLKSSFVYPEQEEWTSSQGKVVKAKFQSLSDDNQLTLVVEKFGQSDRTFKLPLDKFNQASQEKAKKWKETLITQNEKLEKAKAEALKK